MKRKRFVKKLACVYVAITERAKLSGCDPELIRRQNLLRAKDYKLPTGMTYQGVWNNLKSLREYYNVVV